MICFGIAFRYGVFGSWVDTWDARRYESGYPTRYIADAMRLRSMLSMKQMQMTPWVSVITVHVCEVYDSCCLSPSRGRSGLPTTSKKWLCGCTHMSPHTIETPITIQSVDRGRTAFLPELLLRRSSTDVPAVMPVWRVVSPSFPGTTTAFL